MRVITLGPPQAQSLLRLLCEERGWLWVGRALTLDEALVQIEELDAQVIVARTVTHVAPSVMTLGQHLVRFQEQGLHLVVNDLGLDTTDAAGELVARILITFAQWEAHGRSEATLEGLARARDAGKRLGAPRGTDPALARRIRRLFASGTSYQAITRLLNEEGVPSARGGRWYPSTVRMVAIQEEI